MFTLRPDCEKIGKSHDFEVINVYPVNPFHLDVMITNMPEDAIEDYSTVIYECRKCLATMMIEMPTTEAELEEENSEKGKVGTTRM